MQIMNAGLQKEQKSELIGAFVHQVEGAVCITTCPITPAQRATCHGLLHLLCIHVASISLSSHTHIPFHSTFSTPSDSSPLPSFSTFCSLPPHSWYLAPLSPLVPLSSHHSLSCSSTILSLPLLLPSFAPLRFNEVCSCVIALRSGPSHLPSLTQVCPPTESHCSPDPPLEPAWHKHTPATNNDTFIHLTHRYTHKLSHNTLTRRATSSPTLSEYEESERTSPHRLWRNETRKRIWVREEKRGGGWHR